MNCKTSSISLPTARLAGGLGVGVSTIAAPIYIAEIAPAESRGKMTAAFQFNIVFGVLVALTSNLLLKDIGENAWRFMRWLSRPTAQRNSSFSLRISFVLFQSSAEGCGGGFSRRCLWRRTIRRAVRNRNGLRQTQRTRFQ